ncbi:unnamed protein product [Allacma fusca]|uniref:Uncharacterized protein n=1 Tax=Allacma fusca TaxID=39272 RepID=A0A8J2NS94_9HEXA|nr:unnamed protein product [Allacma fusca]
MGLEKRVRKLEKQIVLLKAKIKANDLWKMELQTWIYQKFKRLIVDQVPCSPSSTTNSSSESEPETMEAGVNNVKTRRKRKRQVKPVEKSNTSPTRRTNRKQLLKRASLNTKPEILDKENDIDHDNEQEMALHLLENVHQDLIVVHDEMTTVKTEQDTNGTEGGVEVVMNSDEDQGGQNVTYAKRSQPSYYTVTDVTGPDSEVRPDLQKYFRFVASPINDGKLRLLCLVEGCGTVLKVRPRCKWFNPVRHLAGVHKISEYVEQTPSSAMLPKASASAYF